MITFRDPEPIEVEFGDRKRSLILTIFSLRKADQKLKELREDPNHSLYTTINYELAAVRPLLRAMADKEAEIPSSAFAMSLDFLSVMMWAAMLDQDPDLTFEQAERMIRDPMKGQVVVAVLLYQTFFGEDSTPNAEVETASPLEQPLNGISSGLSLASS